jgi:hypothetical protein
MHYAQQLLLLLLRLPLPPCLRLPHLLLLLLLWRWLCLHRQRCQQPVFRRHQPWPHRWPAHDHC